MCFPYGRTLYEELSFVSHLANTANCETNNLGKIASNYKYNFSTLKDSR